VAILPLISLSFIMQWMPHPLRSKGVGIYKIPDSLVGGAYVSLSADQITASLPILLLAHLLHPVHHLAIFLFLNGDVRHGCGWACAVPVFFSGGEPDDVSGAYLFNGAAFALAPSAAGCDDEGLAERMRVPGRPRAGFKGYVGTLDKCRVRRLKQRINPHRAGEPVFRAFAGWLRACSFDFHFVESSL
jgi:hypothetical protein